MSTPPPAYYPPQQPTPNYGQTPLGSAPRSALLPWFGFGSAVLAFLLAVVPFSAGIAWLPALAAIVLGILSLVRKARPTWASIVAVTLGPIAWLIAIVVTVVVWAIASAGQIGQVPPAAAPQQPIVTATSEPIEVEESAATPSAESVESPAEAPALSPTPVAEVLPGIGETVMVDDWAFTVVSVGARATTAGESRYSDGTQAQGEFVPIVIRIENRGTAAESFSPNAVVAIDPEGREFSYSSDASIYADDSLEWYDEINPGNAVEGAIYFDVPPGTPLDRVLLDVGWFSEPAEISLQ